MYRVPAQLLEMLKWLVKPGKPVKPGKWQLEAGRIPCINEVACNVRVTTLLLLAYLLGDPPVTHRLLKWMTTEHFC